MNIALFIVVCSCVLTAGYVDIWSNTEGTKPKHSFKGPSKVSSLCLSSGNHQQVAAVFGNHVRLEAYSSNSPCEKIDSIDFPEKVSSILLFYFKGVLSDQSDIITEWWASHFDKWPFIRATWSQSTLGWILLSWLIWLQIHSVGWFTCTSYGTAYYKFSMHSNPLLMIYFHDCSKQWPILVGQCMVAKENTIIC